MGLALHCHTEAVLRLLVLGLVLLAVLYDVNIPEMTRARHRPHHAKGCCAGCTDRHVLKHYIYALCRFKTEYTRVFFSL